MLRLFKRYDVYDSFSEICLYLIAKESLSSVETITDYPEVV